MFVIGAGVQGGVTGADPNVDDLDEAGNLKMEFDFRQVYASVLGQWLGASDREIYSAALPRRYEQLPLFRPDRAVSPEFGNGADALQRDTAFPNPAFG